MIPPLITILGPTAIGKTRFAVKLAAKYSGEIISADSRQVYKYMDIGTGKDLNEYVYRDLKIPCHLIDILHPSEEYNLYSFQADVEKSFNEITMRNNLPFLVGGTGMYLSSIIQNYKLSEKVNETQRINELDRLHHGSLKKILLKLKPWQHNITDLEDKERTIKGILVAESSSDAIPLRAKRHLVIGIMLQREEIRERITVRLKDRLKNGMIEEAEKLVDEGISYDRLKLFGLEYKYLALYLIGELNYNDMFQKLNSAIHGFAKRQMTWFRKMEREGVKINWMAPSDIEAAEKCIDKFLLDQ